MVDSQPHQIWLEITFKRSESIFQLKFLLKIVSTLLKNTFPGLLKYDVPQNGANLEKKGTCILHRDIQLDSLYLCICRKVCFLHKLKDILGFWFPLFARPGRSGFLKSVNPKVHYLRNIITYLIMYIERFQQCELAEFKYAVFSKNSAKRGNIMHWKNEIKCKYLRERNTVIG